ncbi:PGF-CTERM sorting domain-containing protein [Haloarcula sp. CBA1130]|uniref:DUF7282 domain-containing protein n=1 Tax=unclassified Haloarcula TaxID=2624677 RepID=UPI0012446DF7|nr:MULTISPECIES: BGTF surface domain-containing protein [unclassified Haloarcula]KAA9398135.1 PGF-CTERM sorting domain-containing protein [Haloarcula sp. CBA1129]KAA9402178.1 PGF-CTERM sorting domain-containing protein [Haloarcula sp. CBA1130]
MTDTNEKIRSLFLTALMVFSVFAGTIAFSGGAAAAANVEIQQATEYNSDSGDIIEVVTNNSINDPNTLTVANDTNDGDVQVVVDGVTNPGDVVTTGTTVTQNGEQLEIPLDGDITPDAEVDVRIYGVSATGGDNVDLVQKDIDVTSQTLTAGTTIGPKTNLNYVNVFRGETLAIQRDSTSSDSFNIEVNDGSLVASDSLNSNSDVYRYDTEDLDTGEEYNVTIAGKSAGFQVSDLNLNVEADDNDITDEDDIIVNATINRGGEEANATLYDDSGDRVSSKIDTLSGNDDTPFIFKPINQTNGFDADDGPYTVEVTDRQTNITVSTDQINVSESEDGDVSFESSVVNDERGDVVNITYQLDNEDEAVVFVGDDDDDNYAISGTIDDDDGDGEVTVSFNSYLAGLSDDSIGISADDILYVEGDDEINNVNEHGSFTSNDRSSLNDETIEPSSYNLNATAGTSQDSSADSVGTLRLSERSTESMRSWVAPRDAELDDDDIDIRDRIGQNLTQANEIANKSIVVHEVSASGIEGALEYEQEVNGSSDVTQAFLRAGAKNTIDEDKPVNNKSPMTGLNALNFSVEKTNVGANVDNEEMVLNSSNVVVVDDPDNNTYFVGVKTANAKYAGGNSVRSQDDTDEITANFSVTPYAAFDNENDGVEDDYSIVERDASVDTTNGLVTVQAATDQQITGTTTVAPGAEVELEVESESQSNPFLERPEVTVEPDNTYTATLDFSEQSAGTNFTAQFLDTNGDELGDEEDGEITDAATASVSISDQESDGSEVVVDSAQLSAGGFIAIHAGNASGDVVGNSEYLEAGSHEDITITLDESMDEDFTAVAMPHLDTNGNEAYNFPGADGPYTANGSAVTDSANVTVGAEEPTATEEPTETETEEQTEEQTQEQTEESTMDSSTEEAETTEESGPGFTAAIALIALVAAALLAVRRDN